MRNVEAVTRNIEVHMRNIPFEHATLRDICAMLTKTSDNRRYFTPSKLGVLRKSRFKE